MDPFEELEHMAYRANIDDAALSEGEPSDADVQRWRELFQYSHLDAIEKIKQHRVDLSRPKVPDVLWERLKDLPEQVGFDREAYEHKLQLLTKRPVGSSNGMSR